MAKDFEPVINEKSSGEKKGIFGVSRWSWPTILLEAFRPTKKSGKSETRVLPPYQAENMLCIISPQKNRSATLSFTPFD